LLITGECVKVGHADHATITDQNNAREGKARGQIGHDFAYGRYVEAIAWPRIMGDRPTAKHHQADDDLDVVRFAVAAVAMACEGFGPMA